MQATHEHAIMNSFDTTGSSSADKGHGLPRDIGASGSSRPHSSMSNRRKLGRTASSSSTPQFQPASSQPMTASSQRQQPSHDEETPIINRNSGDGRNYQSTESSRNGDTGPDRSPQDSQRASKSPTNTDPAAANSGHATQNEAATDSGPSWYKRLAEKYGSLELDNKGSVARDHLALERTFLAWLRTSLAFASIGIAITQLFRLSSSISSKQLSSSSDSSAFPPLLSPPYYNSIDVSISSNSTHLRQVGKPLGATFIAIAILILVLGFHRYFESQYWIVRGKFPASRGSVAIVSFVAAALIVASLVVILAIAPGAMEK